MVTKYGVVVCDPPWRFGDKLVKMKRRTHRSADSQYETMSKGQIIDLGPLVKRVCDADACVIAMWVPSTLLRDGLDVIDAWGFDFKQTFVWVKVKNDPLSLSVPLDDRLSTSKQVKMLNGCTRVGMGRIFRQAHEIALIGTMGKGVYRSLRNKSQRSVMFDLNVGHSTKPDGLHERFETMFPDAPKLELFARRTRDGWRCMGDAIDGRSISDVLIEIGECQDV